VRSNDGKKLEFTVEAVALPATIVDAIVNQNAQLVVDVDNPGALYRQVVPTVDGRFSLPVGQILGEVSVTPLILAASPFSFAPSVHDEVVDVYAGAGPFTMAPGDPIAIGDSLAIYVDHSGRSSSNMIEMVSDPNAKDNLFEVNTGSNALQIRVSPTTHSAFTNMYRTNQTKPAFVMGVVKDAILIGISSLSEGGEDVMDRAWARALHERVSEIEPSLLEEDEFDLIAAHKVAQEIVRSQGIDVMVATDD
jgi:hypothetical protein